MERIVHEVYFLPSQQSNSKQIYNENVIHKEGETELYQWAQLFMAKSWEEIRMLAEKTGLSAEEIRRL